MPPPPPLPATTLPVAAERIVPSHIRLAEMLRLAFSTLGLALLFGLTAAVALAEPADDAIEFNRDIRPILSDNCFVCHGPDAAQRQAGLRLDIRADAILSAIVPGDAEASEMIIRVFEEDPDLVMPPPSSTQLTDQQKELLRRWTDAGAEYQSHWAFVTPQRPAVPEVDDPRDHTHPIDRFLLRALQAQGLQPQDEADRQTLIRRLSIDITGLPPTLQQIDDFLDDDSADAYQRLVDRLLASPRYGERMAADWLDVARYSDSYGMQVDRDRRVWPYRDWVIGAFNRGLPYDQFVTQQLAGDLLPDATDDQILATAFNRLHPQECEGGSVPEEFRSEYVADRTQTIGTAFMGLTLECCRCHDHKYDPLSQQEYYQLTSFFDNIDEAGLYSYFTDACPTPTLPLPEQDQRRQIEQLQAEVDQAQRRLAAVAQQRQQAFQRWRDSIEVESFVPDDAIAHLDFEQDEAPKGTRQIAGRVGRALRFSGDDSVDLDVGNFRRWEPFTVALWLRVQDHKPRAVVFHRSRAWTDAASRGYELLIDQGHLRASLIHFWPGNAVSVRTTEPLVVGQWQHLAVAWDGSSRADGLTIYVDGRPAETEVVRDGLTKQITGGGGDHIQIGARFRDRGLSGGDCDQFQVFQRRLSDLEIASLAAHPGAGSAAEASDEMLLDHYLSRIDELHAQRAAELQQARAALCELLDATAEIMVMRELDPPRTTHFLHRGAYDAVGDPVTPKTPAALLPWDSRWERNRLGFARWLTDPRHPLTARVAINRLWQSFFGRGLVDTPEDFGNQGSMPSHPELLDWLAVEFMESGWDVKRMVRLMVSSAAYRQAAAAVDPNDPENVYLARAPRYRWSAEVLRDAALLASGLLCQQIGGPPAKPYEVEASFKPVPRDRGRGLHRRSLYTYWNRTGPAPALTTLDASLRDVCRMRREVTATPLQSLVILNSPQFVEAARGVATRLHRQHGQDTREIALAMFRMLTGRRPDAQELQLLIELHRRQRQRFIKQPEAAERWLNVGQTPPDPSLDPASLAASASLANTLISYDGYMTKR